MNFKNLITLELEEYRRAQTDLLKNDDLFPSAPEGKKSRAWLCILYPESMPQNVGDLIDINGYPLIVSPLHDSDFNVDGSKKKSHFHVMYVSEGPTTESNVKSVFSSIGGVGCYPAYSIRQSLRYFCHLDNPEKHQYNPDDLYNHSDCDILDLMCSQSSRTASIADMMDFIDQECIVSFAQFCRYCRKYNELWFQSLTSNSAYVIDKYIKSCKWEQDVSLASDTSEPSSDDIKQIAM